MELLDHHAFGKIRFVDFFPHEEEMEKLVAFDFMDDHWIGEAIGFTQFLRLRNDPEVTRSISLSLEDIPESTTHDILLKLKIPLKRSVNIQYIMSILGQPKNELQFQKDRKDYEFILGDEYPYYISCTVHQNRGLIYLVIMNHEKTLKELDQ